MRIRGSLTLALATTATLTALTTPAHASTAFHSDTLAYTCSFPGPSVQPVTVTEDFAGPDTVVPGVAFTVTNLSGRITLSDGALAALTGAGYDGVDRGLSYMIVTAANATSGTTASSGTVDQKTWVPGSATIDFHGGRQPWTAGSSGVITFRRTTSLYLLLSLHRQAGNPGPTGLGLTCTQQDGQDAAFTPDLPIG